MVIVFASSAVDRGFESRSDQTKDYKIGICCFSANHAALRRKSNDWLARSQDGVRGTDWLGVRMGWGGHVYPRNVQSGPHHHHHHLNYNYNVLAMIYLKNCWVGVKPTITHSSTHSLTHKFILQSSLISDMLILNITYDSTTIMNAKRKTTRFFMR